MKADDRLCGHDLDPSDEWVCLVRDGYGHVHQVRVLRDRCTCHNTPLSELEGTTSD